MTRTDRCVGTATHGITTSLYPTATIITTSVVTNREVFPPITETLTLTTTLYGTTSLTYTYYWCVLPTWTLTPFYTTITVITTTTTTTGQAGGTTTITPTTITATGWVRLTGFVNQDIGWTRSCVLQAGGYYSCPTITVPLNTLTYTVPVRRIYITPIVAGGDVAWVRTTTTLMYTLTCSLAPGYTCNAIPEYTVAYVIGYAGMEFTVYVNTTRPSIVKFVYVVRHYVAPDYYVDPNIFVPNALVNCYLIPNAMMGIQPMPRALVQEQLEFDPPRLKYVIVRYELTYTYTTPLMTGAPYWCYVHYTNPYPRVQHIFYLTGSYIGWA